MPDWIGDRWAGVGPEATRVFGRNAQIPVVRGNLLHVWRIAARSAAVRPTDHIAGVDSPSPRIGERRATRPARPKRAASLFPTPLRRRGRGSRFDLRCRPHAKMRHTGAHLRPTENARLLAGGWSCRLATQQHASTSTPNRSSEGPLTGSKRADRWTDPRLFAQPAERSLAPAAQFRSMNGWSGRRPGLHRRPQAAPRRTSRGPPNRGPPSRQGGHGRGPRRASVRPRVRPRLVQAANP
jgi:hypothetical protein